MPAPDGRDYYRARGMNVEVAVIHVDVPPKGRRYQRQGDGVVDKLDEGAVQADEGEAVQVTASRTLATPDRVDAELSSRRVASSSAFSMTT